MNVYSIVPSQRSHATVSVRISKTIPRWAQMTAPIGRLAVSRSTSSVPPLAWTPFAMNTIVSVLATGPQEERELPPAVALDQVGVALDHAEQLR